MNLIYSGDEWRATKVSANQKYSLDEITFFLEKKYVNLRFYMIIKDAENHIDIAPMTQVNSTNASYYNYQCSATIPVKAKNGLCSISLIGFDTSTNKITFTTPAYEVGLDNLVYNFKAQISMLEDFNKNGADLYNKMLALYQGMVKLSELNVDMVKDAEVG